MRSFSFRRCGLSVFLFLATLLALLIGLLKVAIAEEILCGKLVYLKPVKVVASSFDTTPDWAPLPDPMAACDGDLLTRWSSDYKEGESIYFDLGEPKSLNKIIIRWETACSADYDILISNDSKDWKPLLSNTNQDGGTDEMNFDSAVAQFVKLISVRRNSPKWGISIWEFEIYGSVELNPKDKPIEEVYPKRAETKERSRKELEIIVSPGPISLDEFQKGAVYTSWKTGELSSDVSDSTLKHLYDIGVRHVSFMIAYYQDEIDSASVYSAVGKDTVSDEDLIHAINVAHSLGMKVMLKPHVDVRTDEHRGCIIPSEGWFNSYKDYILRYAKLAGKCNVEIYCIGTELTNTTTKKWETAWRDLIKEVRGLYSGKIFYAANWDEFTNVSFWDALDFVGMDAYFPLTDTNSPTSEELILAWGRHARKIDEWREEANISKPLIFSELGYSSADGTNKYPWKVLSGLGKATEDQQEQSDCLNAMFTVMTKRPYFKGIYLWHYFPQEVYSPLGFTVITKMAEKTLEEWFGKLNGGDAE